MEWFEPVEVSDENIGLLSDLLKGAFIGKSITANVDFKDGSSEIVEGLRLDMESEGGPIYNFPVQAMGDQPASTHWVLEFVGNQFGFDTCNKVQFQQQGDAYFVLENTELQPDFELKKVILFAA